MSAHASGLGPGERRLKGPQPDSDGPFPALVSFSPYPRQLQTVEAPVFFVEAGRSDFFVPRGYAHVIVNARGTGGDRIADHRDLAQSDS
jgi:hypothetical protein